LPKKDAYASFEWESKLINLIIVTMDINAKWDTIESDHGLSVATVKVLNDNGIETMADFVACDPDQLASLRKPDMVNIGQWNKLQAVKRRLPVTTTTPSPTPAPADPGQSADEGDSADILNGLLANMDKLNIGAVRKNPQLQNSDKINPRSGQLETYCTMAQAITRQQLNYKEPSGADSGLGERTFNVPPCAAVTENQTLVFFDLETTGFSRQDDDIIQIAATCEGRSFDSYVMPTKPIPPKVTEITGITQSHGQMFYKRKPVKSTSKINALVMFMDYLKLQPNPILVGHNIGAFDIPIITNKLKDHGLFAVFTSIVSGYLDTLPIAKTKYPKGSEDGEVPNHKQETLVKTLLHMEYEAHNAIGDVIALERLYKEKLTLDVNELSSALISFTYTECLETLKPIRDAGCLTLDMAKRCARASLGYQQLQLAYKRHGISDIFREPSQDGVLVSKAQSVADKVTRYFTSLA